MNGISNKQSPIEIIAAAAEKQKNTLAAICANSWHLPVYKQTLTYEVISTRRATALEEYIMKAAALDLSYDVETSMLPQLLGLDEVFFEEVLEALVGKNIVDKDSLPVLRLTDSGINCLEQRVVPDEAKTDDIEYYIDRKFAAVYASPKEEPRLGMHPKYELIDKKKENVKKYINRKFLIEAGKTLGRQLEDAKLGTRITSVVSARTTDAAKTLFTEVCLYDIAEGKLVRKVWDYARKCFRDDWAQLLDEFSIDSGFEVTVDPTCGIAEDVSVLMRQNASSVKICRGRQKDEAIAASVGSAQQQIIFCLPSLSLDEASKIAEMCKTPVLNGVGVTVKYGSAVESGDWPNADGINFEKSKQADSGITEIIIDNSACIVSGIKWASCSGSAMACSDAVYVINDAEFAEQRGKCWGAREI